MHSLQHDFFSTIRKNYGPEVEHHFKLLNDSLKKNFPQASIHFNSENFICKIVGAESLDCQRFLQIFTLCTPKPPEWLQRPLNSWKFNYLGKDVQGIHLLTLDRIVSQKEFKKIINAVRKISDNLTAAFKPKTPQNNTLFFTLKTELNNYLVELQSKQVSDGIDRDLRILFYYQRRLIEIFTDNAHPAKL